MGQFTISSIVVLDLKISACETVPYGPIIRHPPGLMGSFVLNEVVRRWRLASQKFGLIVGFGIVCHHCLPYLGGVSVCHHCFAIIVGSISCAKQRGGVSLYASTQKISNEIYASEPTRLIWCQYSCRHLGLLVILGTVRSCCGNWYGLP